jgi:hypothetical protein
LVRKIIRIFVALSLVVTIVLFLKKPQPLASQPQPAAALSDNANAFQTKLGDILSAHERGESGVETRITADEVRAALVVANSPQPAPGREQNPQSKEASLNSPTTLSPDQVPVKDQQVVFEGDQVKGQFTTRLVGQDLVVSLSGHLGSKDGYVDFVPTSFQIGSLSVPVSLVQETLEKKLSSDPATREKLKLPDYIADLRIENGELVVVSK